MPRTSKGPRYYKSKGGWYATLNGETILLAKGAKKPTEEKAKEQYDAEVAARKVEVDGDRGPVWGILNAYLVDLENRVKNSDASQGTLDIHLDLLKAFNTACGKIIVRKLRPQHVNEWVAYMRQERMNEKLKRKTKWGLATVDMARAVINRAFNWAVEEAGILSKNPLKAPAGKKPKRRKRKPSGARAAITDHEHDLIVEQAKRRSHKSFLHLVTFLRRTGARPAEMYLSKASEWEEDKKWFRIRAIPENRGRFKLWHLGEDRLVYIPDDLVPRVHELIAKYPEGPLFRNESDKPWKVTTICSRMTSIKHAANRVAKARHVVGVRDSVTAYSWRHAFVTNWILANQSESKLCELLNTSPEMLRKHYSHLFEQTGALREALNSFTAGTPTSPGSESAAP